MLLDNYSTTKKSTLYLTSQLLNVINKYLPNKRKNILGNFLGNHLHEKGVEALLSFYILRKIKNSHYSLEDFKKEFGILNNVDMHEVLEIAFKRLNKKYIRSVYKFQSYKKLQKTKIAFVLEGIENYMPIHPEDFSRRIFQIKELYDLHHKIDNHCYYSTLIKEEKNFNHLNKHLNNNSAIFLGLLRYVDLSENVFNKKELKKLEEFGVNLDKVLEDNLSIFLNYHKKDIQDFFDYIMCFILPLIEQHNKNAEMFKNLSDGYIYNENEEYFKSLQQYLNLHPDLKMIFNDVNNKNKLLLNVLFYKDLLRQDNFYDNKILKSFMINKIKVKKELEEDLNILKYNNQSKLDYFKKIF